MLRGIDETRSRHMKTNGDEYFRKLLRGIATWLCAGREEGALVLLLLTLFYHYMGVAGLSIT